MAGAIIENMSTKKLVIVGVILLLFQAFSFMVGGLIAPSPTTAVHYLATKCVDTVKTHHKGSKWFMPWGPDQCSKIRDFDEAMAKRIEANNIVFAVHIPLPNREMSAWFQFMLVILQFDIAFKMQNQIEDGSLVTMDVGLAYRDSTLSEWTEMAHSIEHRKLSCNFTATKTYENEGRYYDCDLLPFMEVGSVAHKYYLLNIRLPVNERKKVNMGIGEIKDIRLVSIHQNGGFTKVWFAMKTFLTPSVLIIMIWYWRRITQMTRPPVLLEKIIFALGISMTFINIPVEWFSVGFNWTWMLLFGDIRQGIFYAMLLSFWIIFCGEHLMVRATFLFFQTIILWATKQSDVTGLVATSMLSSWVGECLECSLDFLGKLTHGLENVPELPYIQITKFKSYSIICLNEYFTKSRLIFYFLPCCLCLSSFKMDKRGKTP
uniref:Protein wntless homolog n=1 Tax=Sinocyclocheilus rhinocerous TaxID=307959 RepID=A0A673FG96_9TELE